MLRLTSAMKFVAPSGRVVVMGIMDPGDLDILITPAYQRELLPVRSVEEWQQAFFAGEVPPLDLGSFQSRVTVRKDGGVTIAGDVNIIDGVQRRTAARLIRNQGGTVWLPVMVYLGTTYEWELARFRVLNGNRRQVSTNVLLRNARQANAAIDALYAMSVDEYDSVLSGRVQWEQNPRPGNLFTAVSLVRTVALLHHHFGKGMRESSAEHLAWALDDVATDLSKEVFRKNVEIFFGIIGAAVDIATVQKPRNFVQLRLGYLLSLASMLGGRAEFWRGSELVLTKAALEGLSAFRLDPLQVDAVSNRGRVMEGLVERLEKAASPRRTLTPW